MDNQINVVVCITTQVGKANEQIQAFAKLAPLVRAEQGCLQYELTQSINDENQFVLIEKWASMADLQAHGITPHMIAANAKNPEFRASPAQVFITKSVSSVD